MMSRLRVLEAENTELARQKESGRPAKVANLIGLRRRFIERIRLESAREWWKHTFVGEGGATTHQCFIVFFLLK